MVRLRRGHGKLWCRRQCPPPDRAHERALAGTGGPERAVLSREWASYNVCRTRSPVHPVMRALRIASVVMLAHVALLFFPPLPPIYKGSLWSYALSYLVLILFLRAGPAWKPTVTAWWAARSPAARVAGGLALMLVVGLAGLLLREVSPDTFARFSREEGLWEPLTLVLYVGSASLLLRPLGEPDEASRRHLLLLGGVFVLFTLEEIDYFGIFGGIIGRVDGIYVGSLHDLIQLWKANLLPVPVVILLGAGSVAALAWLLSRGYVQPRRLLGIPCSSQAVWLTLGVGFLLLAAAEEAAIAGVSFGLPTPEELIELLGAIALSGFALEAHAATESGAPGPIGARRTAA